MENQLTINEPLVLARLRPDKFPRLMTLQKNDAVLILIDIISRAYLYKGYRPDDDNVKFMAETLYEEMMMDNHHMGMPNISMFEVGYAIKKAVMDNDDFFFSVSYLYNIIKKYCLKEGHDATEEARKIVKAEQQKQLSSPAQTMIDDYAGKMVNHTKNL